MIFLKWKKKDIKIKIIKILNNIKMKGLKILLEDMMGKD